MMKIRNILLIIALSINFIVAKPDEVVERLKEDMNSASADVKFDIALQLAEEYTRISSDSSLYYAEMAFDLSKIAKNEMAAGKAYNALTKAYLSKKDYDEAMYYVNLAVDEFEEKNSPLDRADALINKGIIYRERTKYDESIFVLTEAQQIFQQKNFIPGILKSSNILGSTYWRTSNYIEALKCYDLALNLARSINKSDDIISILNNMATCYKSLGDYGAALKFYQEAIQMNVDTKNDIELGNSYNYLGNVYLVMNSHSEALDAYERSLQIRRDLNDTLGMAKSHDNIGKLYQNQYDYPNAIRHYESSLIYRNSVNDQIGLAASYNNLGAIYKDTKQYSKSFESYFKSLNYYRAISDSLGLAMVYKNMGSLFGDLKNFKKASKYYEEALKIEQKVDDPSRIAYTLTLLGNSHKAASEFEKALESYKKVETIRLQLGNEKDLATTYDNIGGVYSDLKQFESAASYFEKSLAIGRKFNDSLKIANDLNNLGNISFDIGQNEKASEYFMQALVIYKNTGNNYGISLCSRKLGEIHALGKRNEKAFVYLKEALKIAGELGNKDLILRAEYAFYSYFKGTSQFDKALVHFEHYNTLKDSIDKELNNQKLIEAQVSIDLENMSNSLIQLKKDYDILAIDAKDKEEKLLREKIIKTLFAFASVFLVIIIVLLWNRFHLRRKANLQLEEKIRHIEEINKALEESESQLRILNATKDKFFSIISHDLKNTVSGILNASKALKSNFAELPEEDKYQYSDLLHEASIQLYSLLENLLQWARSQTGRLKNQPVNFEIKDIIDNNLFLMKLNAQEKQINLESRITDDVEVYGDRDMFTTILRNLVSNAVKFTNNGGAIEIISKPDKDMIEMEIRDTGVGIPTDNIMKLFHIDTNQSTPGTANEKGTGLGMVLCKEFAERNGGKLWIHSEIGKGTSVFFTIPMAKK